MRRDRTSWSVRRVFPGNAAVVAVAENFRIVQPQSGPRLADAAPCMARPSLYKAAFLPHTPYPAQSLVGRARQDERFAL